MDKDAYKKEFPNVDFVIGSIYHGTDSSLLDEDMFYAEFGEFAIDVGWLPQCDPEGNYHVNLLEGSWENRVCVLRTQDYEEVLRYVRSFSRCIAELHDTI